MFFYNGVTSDNIAGILYTDISDHLPLFVINRLQPHLYSSSQPINIKFRKFTDSAEQQFKNRLQSFSWDELYQINDTGEAYNFFIKIITDEYQNAFPITEKAFKKHKNSHLWLSENLKEKIH